MDISHDTYGCLVWLEAACGIRSSSYFDPWNYTLRMRNIESCLGVRSPSSTIDFTIHDLTYRLAFLYGYFLGRHPWLVRSTIEFAPYGIQNMNFLSRPASPAEQQQMVEVLAEKTWMRGRSLPQNLPKLADHAYLIAWDMALGEGFRPSEVVMGVGWLNLEKMEPGICSASQLSSGFSSMALEPSLQEEETDFEDLDEPWNDTDFEASDSGIEC